MIKSFMTSAASLAIVVFLSGCNAIGSTMSTSANIGPGADASLAKNGFYVEVEDGRLWVLQEGEEKSEKHDTLIGAGPRGMTIKALNQETAMLYLASKPGFNVEIEDGRLWVLRPGEEKSEKHDTLIGAGPNGMTIKALNQETALLYLASKPGFDVEIEDGRLWVLRPGEEKSEKHDTLIGAGPRGMTVKALNQETALAYLATREGFNIEIEDGRIWALLPGQERSEKHVTAIGAGARNATVKALTQDDLNAYLNARL